MLSAEWFSAAASVCASCATSISRVCSAGATAEPAAPMPNSTSSAVHGLCEASTNTARTTPSAPIDRYSARMTDWSANRPPTRLPTTMPTPKTISANGTRDRGKPATSVIVVLM